MSTNEQAVLRIRRAAPGEAERYEDHVVPFEPGQSLLDGLRYVRAHAEPGLAFRYSCINANASSRVITQCTPQWSSHASRVHTVHSGRP